MQVVELRDRAIDNESDKEEEAGDGATDGVDQAQDAGNKNQVNQVQVAVNEKSIKCLELLGFSVKRICRMKAT